MRILFVLCVAMFCGFLFANNVPKITLSVNGSEAIDINDRNAKITATTKDGISITMSNFRTNMSDAPDTYSYRLKGENKKAFEKNPIKYLLPLTNHSVAANLKIALYFAGANENIFDQIGADNEIAYNQQFGGLIANASLFIPANPKTDYRKSYLYCKKAIKVESGKDYPDKYYLNDLKILLRSILLNSEKHFSEKDIKQEIQELENELIFPTNLVFSLERPIINASSARYFAFAANYCFNKLNEVQDKEFAKREKKAIKRIISNKSVLPYWTNFYFGFILPKDKKFAIEILKAHTENDIGAYFALCDIYSGEFDEADKDEKKYKYYVRAWRKKFDKQVEITLTDDKQLLDKYLPKNPTEYLTELMNLEKSNRVLHKNKMVSVIRCLKIISQPKKRIFTRYITGKCVVVTNTNYDGNLFNIWQKEIENLPASKTKSILKQVVQAAEDESDRY